MGKKVVSIIAGLTGAALCCSICGSLLATHNVSFSTGYILHRVRIETSLPTADIRDGSPSIFCSIVNNVRPDTCQSGTVLLQEVSQKFCAPVVAHMFPQACQGFEMAYLLGMITLIVLFMNAILCCTAVFLLSHYINSEKPKKTYRDISLGCFATGTVLLSADIVAYGCVVFTSLKDISPTGGSPMGEMVFKPSEGLGISWGYIFLVFNVVLQCVIMALYPLAKTSQEIGADEHEERKLAQQLALEPGYGGTGDQPQQPPGWGQQPNADGMQVGFPMQQPLPQPMYGTPGGW